MASAERTTELLRGAGFAEVRTEEVPVRFVVAGRGRVPGPRGGHRRPARARAARARREPTARRSRAEVEDSLGRFAAADGYELPGVALCAVAW